MEYINSIKFLSDMWEKYRKNNFGFEIETNQRNIIISMNREQNCCENFYTTINIVGNEVFSYDVSNNKLEKEFNVNGLVFNDLKINEKRVHENDEENSVELDFIDNNTVLISIAMFNEHNGYYPHNVEINWKWNEGIDKQGSYESFEI